MFLRTRQIYLFSCLLLALFLTSCGGYTTRVIDTPETRELKGWQKPYEVNGQRFHPLRDYYGFQQRGIASWYGRKFHGRKTSNGEVYDMYGKSAAHKTLPMGIYVRVINLDNNREIVVRINDRGPFVSGRIIDLSYGAAKQLGIVKSGLAQVKIYAIGSQKTKQNRVTSRVAGKFNPSSFAVQIGAFSSSANADRLAAELPTRYGRTIISTAMVSGQQIFRVRVGDFNSLEQAEKAVESFISGGFTGSHVVAFD